MNLGTNFCRTIIILLMTYIATLRCDESETVSLVPAQSRTILNEGVYIQTRQEPDGILHAEMPALGPPQLSPLQLDDSPTDRMTILEGDIMVNEGGKEEAYNRPPGSSTIPSRTKRKISGNAWPKGVIPWEISPLSSPYRPETLEKIGEAMKWWERHTCVQFIPIHTKPDVGHDVILSIRNHLKCSSYVGFQDQLATNKQSMNLLESTCFRSVGTAAHELGHALGLIHEHSRIDRDEHVVIHPDSIHPNNLHNYAKSHNSEIPSDVYYDLSSIMHYNPNTFSILSGDPAMTGRNLRKQSLMGQREALSFYDIKAVNLHYQCEGGCVNNCGNEGYPRYVDGRCLCVCPEGLSGSQCQKIDSDCGDVLPLSGEQSTTLDSSKYTDRSSASKCIWLVTAPSGYYIELNFEVLEVARTQPTVYKGYECIHDVEVRNNLLGQRGDTYCGTGPVGPINTEMAQHKERMLVVLNKNSHMEGNPSKFKATIRVYRDACLSYPCHHGSTCQSHSTGTFTCSCPLGFSGTLCDHVTNGGVSCDFSRGFCGFSQSKEDDLDFHREFQSYKYNEEIKSLSNGNKYFIGAPIEYALPRLGATVSLRSPVLLASGRKTRCLTFSYYMNGDWQTGELTVNLVHPGSNRPIKTLVKFSRYSQSGVTLLNGWKKEMKEITNDGDYEVLFTFMSSRVALYNSMMALDDISILPQHCYQSSCNSNPCKGGAVCSDIGHTSYQCLCPPGRSGSTCTGYNTEGFTCDFNSDTLCGWTQDSTDDFDWIRTHGASDSLKRTGPVKSAVGEGYYMVADTSASTSSLGSTARLISPPLYYTGVLCVSFYYHMHGRNVGTLTAKLKALSGNGGSSFFTKSGEQSTEWQHISVEVNVRDYNSQLVFQVTSGERHLSDIAIDDITIARGQCRQTQTVISTTPLLPAHSPPSLNGYRIHKPSSPRSTTEPSVTTRRPPTTPSPTTRQNVPSLGNSGHRTSGRFPFTGRNVAGHFVYLPPQPSGFIATTKGPSVSSTSTPTTTTSITTTQTKRLLTTTKRPPTTTTVSTTRTTTQRSKISPFTTRSHPHSVHRLPPVIKPALPTTPPTMSTTTTRGSTRDGDSLRQILLSRLSQSRASVPSNVAERLRNQQRLIAKKRNKKLVSCNFEEDICPEYLYFPVSTQLWERRAGPTTSSGTGPDFASEGSYYIHMDASIYASTVRDNNLFQISTYGLKHSGQICITFDYHMKGATVDKLSVYYNESGSNLMLLLWQQSGDQGSHWQQAELTANISRGGKIVIEAARGHSYQGDIAIDRLSISKKRCREAATPRTLLTTVRQTIPPLTSGSGHTISTRAPVTRPTRARPVTRPTRAPVTRPTRAPVTRPTRAPVTRPTRAPVTIPTRAPVTRPTGAPVTRPTRAPVTRPTRAPVTRPIRIPLNRSFRAPATRSTRAPVTRSPRVPLNRYTRAPATRSTRAPVTRGPVTTRPIFNIQPESALSYSCNFERKNLCDFTNSMDEDTDWIIHSGETPSSGTGPHSAYSGSTYIYVEASNPTRPGAKAKLVTPTIPANAGYLCLTFYSNMYGDDMGTLLVYSKYDNGRTRRHAQLVGHTDTEWQKHSFNIWDSPHSFQIVFEGTVAQGPRHWLSDIALDDISLTSGTC